MLAGGEEQGIAGDEFVIVETDGEAPRISHPDRRTAPHRGASLACFPQQDFVEGPP
jgi:hypothetical protein